MKTQHMIHFTNAQWNPTQGIDSNLRIDRIEIDGVVFETEDPEVFSTGTRQPGVGFQTGFKESEWLHGNGYFQYAGTGTTEPPDPTEPPPDVSCS